MTKWSHHKHSLEIKICLFCWVFNREEDLFWFSFHKKLPRVAGENSESPEVTNSPYYCQSTPTCASKDVRIQPASPLLMIPRRSNMTCLKEGEETGSWSAVCEGVWRFPHTGKCSALIRMTLLSGRHILRLNKNITSLSVTDSACLNEFRDKVNLHFIDINDAIFR